MSSNVPFNFINKPEAEAGLIHNLNSTVINDKIFLISDGRKSIPVKYSYFKTICTNNYIEVFESSVPYILNRVYNKGSSKSREPDPSRSREYKLRNIKRTKDMIRRLCKGNFKSSEVRHLVLTFRNGLDFDITNLSVCNKVFNAFKKRVSYHFPHFKYIKVAEYQERGAVHYHIICNLSYVPSSFISKLWGFGFIKLKPVPSDISSYLYKYLLKSVDDTRFNGCRVWSHSGNLIKPVVNYCQRAFNIKNKLTSLIPTFEYSYKTPTDSIIYGKEYIVN